MSNYAIIPARKGSKRLKDKNKRLLNGKPLIEWTIQAAVNSKCFDTIIVTSDDEELELIANRNNIIFHRRPDELSTDIASSNDVVLDVLNSFKVDDLDCFMLLQPTSPLRAERDICQVIDIFNDNSINSVISVCELEHSPLWSNQLPDSKMMDGFIRPELEGIRSQDLPVYYRVNGAIFAANSGFFRVNNTFYGSGTKAYVMDRKNSVDIDTIEDFEYAEYILAKCGKD